MEIFFVLGRGGWTYGRSLSAQDPLYLHATTACLTAIIVLQIVNVFLCRSDTRSVLATGLFGNKLILRLLRILRGSTSSGWVGEQHCPGRSGPGGITLFPTSRMFVPIFRRRRTMGPS